jgi:hypothetical protein
MKPTQVIALGLLVLPARLLAESSAGTSGGTVLQIPVGARAIGMGEAYVAQADDLGGLYWNPASLGMISQSQASFMYNPLFNDMTYQNASVAVSMENGGIGAGVSYLSYGQIDGFDAAGDPAGDVEANSAVATLGGAWLGNNWTAGFSLKGVQETLADVKATGFAADAGTTLIYPKEVLGGTLRAAAVVRNLGSGLKFISQTDPFPRDWRVGFAGVQMLKKKLNLSLDYGQERKSDGAVYMGAEYWPFPYVALRTGYAGANRESEGLRAGAGLRVKNVSFDYAYSQYGDLGFTHRYEFCVRFGALASRLTPEARQLLRKAKLAMAAGRYGEATQLFDALIQVAPHYRPAQRLVKTAMAKYETEERAESEPYQASLKPMRRVRDDGTADEKELEQLLNLGADNVAGRTQENPQ